jgi:hypothetical protein
MELDCVPVEFNVRLPLDLAKRLLELAERKGMLPRDLLEEIVREYVGARFNSGE